MTGLSSPTVQLYTVGHGTLDQDAFADLVRGAGLHDIVDIRAYPNSRHNPQFAQDRMERWLPDTDLRYSWMRDLGGRRPPRPDSRHVALRHPSFRAYADYMDTADFVAAVDDLLARGTDQVLMCSESVWWRCHRRLVADYVTLVREVPVAHLMHDGRQMPHRPTEGVRRDGDGLAYDAGAPPSSQGSGSAPC